MIITGLKKTMCYVMAGAMIISLACTDMNADAAKSASLKTKSLNLSVKQSKKIVIKNKNSKRKYKFTSSKTSVAKVSAAGKVTGLKTGAAKITVKEIWKKSKKNKSRKLGVIKVTVKTAKKSDSTNVPATTVAVTTTPVYIATPTPIVTVAPGPTTAKPTDKPLITTGPSMAPAYTTYTYDFEDGADGFEGAQAVSESDKKCLEANGSVTLPMANLIRYGAVCQVKASFKQTSGSSKKVTVSYNGKKLNTGTKKEEDFSGTNAEADCASGEWVTLTFNLEIEKYITDCNITFTMADNIKFYMDDVSVSAQPFENADYQSMVNDSFIQTGNTARLKKVIDKARAGEDVTLAYLGGSITEGYAASVTNNADCYAETSYNEFKMAYGAGDGSNVHFINAGMSGTPSSLGVIRYQNDVLNQVKYGKYPDILCIEFVVNDGNECTNGEGIESIIREALEQGSAVFLMFAYTVNFDTQKQEYYMPLGELYDLPMVSMKNGLAGVIDTSNTKSCTASNWYFWSDKLHPDVPGHRFMADAFMNVFYKADADKNPAPDPITSIDSVTPKYGKAFEGMKMIDSTVDVDKVDAIVSLDSGSFCDKDTDQNKFQYKKDGKDNVAWFPDCWMHNSGSNSFNATVKCSNMMIAYKLNSSKEFGTAELYVDGELKETMSGYDTSGWNNATVKVVFKDDKIAEHHFEIRMADGDENKKFTIYAIGYTNADDYKESLEK